MGNLFSRKRTYWVPVNRNIVNRIETVPDWSDRMDFSSMHIQNDPMAKEMILKFNMCETLIEVNLSFNGLGDDECIPIAKSIRSSRTMRRLFLFNNHIHAKGAQALAFALMPNAGQGDPTLEELSLRNNSVGAEGAQSLALVLSCNKRLKKMDLYWNNIRNIGLEAILMNIPAAPPPLPADFRLVSRAPALTHANQP
jgi:Ran GTPase-activating protein (RanGAP) involved in mRNA processing and transport